MVVGAPLVGGRIALHQPCDDRRGTPCGCPQCLHCLASARTAPHRSCHDRSKGTSCGCPHCGAMPALPRTAPHRSCHDRRGTSCGCPHCPATPRTALHRPASPRIAHPCFSLRATTRVAPTIVAAQWVAMQASLGTALQRPHRPTMPHTDHTMIVGAPRVGARSAHYACQCPASPRIAPHWYALLRNDHHGDHRHRCLQYLALPRIAL